jgi:hypothetical protein
MITITTVTIKQSNKWMALNARPTLGYQPVHVSSIFEDEDGVQVDVQAHQQGCDFCRIGDSNMRWHGY